MESPTHLAYGDRLTRMPKARPELTQSLVSASAHILDALHGASNGAIGGNKIESPTHLAFGDRLTRMPKARPELM